VSADEPRATAAPSDDAERAARAALTVAAEPGRLALLAALAEQPAVEVLHRLRRGDAALDPDGRLGRRLGDVDGAAVMERARAGGIDLVVPGDPHWPAGLDALGGVERDRRGGLPLGLWVRGDPRLLCSSRGLAVVGSRAATPYGTGVATDWAADLAVGGLVVVSGAAYGVDAAAHRGALAVGRPTVAVLAGGLDTPYPRGNASLIERISAEGLLVSEAAPGATVNRGRFLLRNRLVAALAIGSLVVEAGMRSGALSTAAWTLALLRPLAAVPGPVTSAMSCGTHRLLREQQAVLVTCPDDVRELVAAYGDLAPLPVPDTRALDGLPEPLLTVREAMPAHGPVWLAELVTATGLPLPTVLAALDALRERDLVDGAGETWQLRPARRTGA
jgi:DNA processing protein